MEATAGKRTIVVAVTQRLHFDVDVTDWLEPEREYTPAELEQLAHDKWEYHDYGSGPECECTGYGWERHA